MAINSDYLLGMPVFLGGLFTILTAAIAISADHDPAPGASTHFLVRLL
jgi:hypothetical protein